jgi:thymidylate synthase
MIKKYQDDDLKNDKNIRKLKLLSIKEFANKIAEDDYFALEYGDLGPVYPTQWTDFGGYTEDIEEKNEYKKDRNETRLVEHIGWRKIHFEGINQIDYIINELQTNPDSRRMIVNAWNPVDLDSMLLAPCHILFQMYTNLLTDKEKELYPNKERKISMQLYIRSNDIFLGNPYNVAEYSLLLHMIAQVVNMVPDEFILTIGDAHLYSNSIEASKELLKREPKELPILKLNPNIQNIYDFRYEDIEILNYNPHTNIKVDVAV